MRTTCYKRLTHRLYNTEELPMRILKYKQIIAISLFCNAGFTHSTSEPYICEESEDKCVQNYNNSLSQSNGQKRVLVRPINFEDTNWSPNLTKIRQKLSVNAEFLLEASRGRYGFSEIVVKPTRKINGVSQSCANREIARKRLSGDGTKYDLKVYGYPVGTCSFSNAGNNKIHMNKGNINNSMTFLHELGHIFHLQHSRAMRGEMTGVFCNKNRQDNDGLCPDVSTYLGYFTPYNRNYNVVDLHWLGWLDKYEVERILPDKHSYTIRAIDRKIENGVEPLALVFDHPISGNRMFLSMPTSADKKKFENDPLNSQELALYIASKNKSNDSWQKSVLVSRFKNEYKDEIGLNIKVIEASTQSKAILFITYEPELASCAKAPEVSVIETVETKKENTKTFEVTLTNPNSKDCRPFFLHGGKQISLVDSKGNVLGKNDGIKIRIPKDRKNKEIKGFDYIWPNEKINRKSKHANQKKQNSFSFSVTSSVISNPILKLQIGDLESIEKPLIFTHEPLNQTPK